MAATLKDIARESGLSIATISKYINGTTVKEKNRIAIEQAIKKLNYTVNEYARGLKSNKSRTIGVVIPELSNLFVTKIITKMEEILRAHGYSTVICDCHTNEKLECEAVQFLLSKRVDGIINMPVCKDGRHLKPALLQHVPITLIDRPLPALGNATDSVLINNSGAAFCATQHLLEHGHKNIGIVVGPVDIFTSQQRLEGYKQALHNQNLPFKESLVVYSDYTIQGGYEGLCKLLTVNPDMTAIFVTNYEMTLGAIIAANERSLQIPQKLSFVGFDNMQMSLITNPKLTIVNQPLEEIATQTARIILDRLTGENTSDSAISVSLSASLQHGDSVARR